MTALLVCAGFTLVLAVYVFYPETRVASQSQKTRLEYLGERKAVLYDNLRDLQFERSAGKYSDEEYAMERATLEDETAAVVAEMDTLEQMSAGGPGLRRS